MSGDIVVRKFRAKRGASAAVTYSLARLGSALIRQSVGASVSIYHFENDPQCHLWVGDCGLDAHFSRIAPDAGASVELLRPPLVELFPPRRLRLLDAHHSPTPESYRIWNVEVCETDGHNYSAIADLHAVRMDPRVIGSALYCDSDDDRMFILFLALVRGATPTAVGLTPKRSSSGVGRGECVGVLRLDADMRRLAGNPTVSIRLGRVPCVPDWLRQGGSSVRHLGPLSLPRSICPHGGEI